MDERRRAALDLAAANSLVVPGHLMVLWGVEAEDAAAELDLLVADELLRRDRVLARAPACYRITQAGLDAIGSALSVPVLDLRRLRREIGATWLWLAARDGRFGAAEWVRSRRELVARGEPADADVVIAVRGGRVAVHLQTVVPERVWLERVLRRYANDPRFGMAIFMVEDDEVGRVISAVAAGLGLSEMTQVRRFELP